MSPASMRLSDFDYDLPPELIAQVPPRRRGESRLLVVDVRSGNLEERRFDEIADVLRAGDLLVMNRSRVLRARLLGRSLRSGRPVELLLHQEIVDRKWSALIRPSAKVKPQEEVEVEGGGPRLVVGGHLDSGQREVVFRGRAGVLDLLEEWGHVPLPPYIERQDRPEDAERYQTVYAREPGSVAAPTAGLHFSPPILERLRTGGIDIKEIVLHVGLGTFQPLREESIGANKLHEEVFHVPADTHRALRDARDSQGTGGRIVAVGTTSARTLETLAQRWNESENRGDDVTGTTDLFVRPPFDFRLTTGLLTNFHLPRSSLLLLVCAFGGVERVLDAYRYAVERRFRFYSYGDAMLLLA